MTPSPRLTACLLLCALLTACATGDLPSEGANNADNNETNNTNNNPNTPNTRPLAAPIASQTVVVGQQVLLDGSASSDADGDALTYTWTLAQKPGGSNVGLEDAGKSVARLTPDVAGDYIVTLVVSDGRVSSAATSAKITANPAQVNRAPVANAGVDRQVATDTLVTLDGTGSSDPDSDALTYTWSLEIRPPTSSAQLNSATASSPAFTPDLPGRYEARLIVRDGKLNSTPDTVVITAIEPTPNNNAPVARVGADQTVDVGQRASLSSQGSSDPDGDSLSFTWTLTSRPNGSQAFLSANDVPSPTLLPDVAGTYRISLVVSDGQLSSNQVTTTVTARALNMAPTADAGLNRSVVTGELVQLDGRASSDPENQSLNYTWALTNKPAGSNAALSSTSTATPTFTPDRDGAYTVSLVVSDGQLSSSAVTITITAGTPCLIISEYIEGFNNNKAIEIYNCGASPLDLAGFGACVSAKSANACTTNCSTNRVALNGVLPVGGTKTLCNSQIADVVKNSGKCDEYAAITSFNGDDRIVLFLDKDANGSFSAGDRITDSFGKYDECPMDAPWTDKIYRRCNLTPYTSSAAFNISQFYVEVPMMSMNNAPVLSDFDHLKVAPMQGCP